MKMNLLETIQPRTLTRVKPGMTFYSRSRDGDYKTFVVVKVYSTLALCKALGSQTYETFNVGDFVQIGIEHVWADRIETDPRDYRFKREKINTLEFKMQG